MVNITPVKRRALPIIGGIVVVILISVGTFIILRGLLPADNNEIPPAKEASRQDPATLEEEAVELLQEDPAAAKEKFDEATKAYELSDNQEKADEMKDNASAAEQQAKDISEPTDSAPPIGVSGR